MTHPYRLHAVAALSSLRRAAVYLADTRDAVLISRPQLGPAETRPRTLAALHAHDRLLRAERADRVVNQRLGVKPAGATRAPIGPGLLDLERDLADGVHHATMLVASALRRRPLLAYGADWITTAPSGWTGRCTYLAAGLPYVPPGLAREIGRDLEHLDARLRALVGLEADLWRLPGAPPCPACGERMLAAQTSAPDSRQWTITCDAGACVCAGRACRCQMTSRPRGIRHIWAPDSPAVRHLLPTADPPAA